MHHRSMRTIDGVWRPQPGELDGDPVAALWGMEFDRIVRRVGNGGEEAQNS